MTSAAHLQQPLAFQPLLKRARWGGRRLEQVLGRPLGPGNDWAESWEIADCGDAQSLVTGGPFAGHTLRQLLQQHPAALLGPQASGTTEHAPPEFPLLVKYLDANDVLSVQVHPDDTRAARMQAGTRGKTEAWVILAAEPGSHLYCGLKAGVNRAQLEAAIAAGNIEHCLHRVTAKPGDCLFIPAGTVHAIGGGILLAEVQQSSDITFRLDDWGRLGADGQPRPLHIDESLECIDFARGPVNPVVPQLLSSGPCRSELLVTCPYFEIRRQTLTAPHSLETTGRFRLLLAIRGSGALTVAGQVDTLEPAAVRLIPAAAGTVHIQPDGELTLLEVGVPPAAVTPATGHS